jgi:hypothetical protein
VISAHPQKPDPNKNWLFTAGFQVSRIDNFDHLTRSICSRVWSPIVWQNGHRAQIDFLSCEYAVLDFDDGHMPIEHAKLIFATYWHIIGTTKSHQKEKSGKICDRFRVVLRWEAAISNLDLYRYNIKYLARSYRSDEACTDGARCYMPCSEIVSKNHDGRFLYVRTPKSRPQKTCSVSTSERRPLSEFVLAVSRYGPTAGKRNVECFRAACECCRKGYGVSDTRHLVFNSVPSDCDFTDREKDTIIKNAFKLARKT